MFAVLSEKWLKEICPNLPEEHYTEYIIKLVDFVPNVKIEELPADFFKGLGGLTYSSWIFPFVDIYSSGRLTLATSDYEEYVEGVEREMATKYNFDIELFST